MKAAALVIIQIRTWNNGVMSPAPYYWLFRFAYYLSYIGLGRKLIYLSPPPPSLSTNIIVITYKIYIFTRISQTGDKGKNLCGN